MSSSYDASTDDEEADVAESPAMKRVKSQPPDVIVSVGSGEDAQEFRCYKVVLSFASGYFDDMLSSSMKEDLQGRIEFPDKDPEEWKIFYTFISPQREVRDNAEIDSENVLMLVPWFHEFRMKDLLQKCDEYLASEYSHDYFKENADFWKKGEDELRKAEFAKLFDVAQTASIYGLESTLCSSRKYIVLLMGLSVDTVDLFDLPTIKTLLQMVSPIQLDGNELKMSDDGCKEIWPALEKIISPHISNLSQEIVTDMSTFPLLVYSFMQIQTEKEKVATEKRKVSSAKTIIKRTIEQYPDGIHSMMTTYHQKSVASDNLKRIVKEHYESEKKHFKRLGINLPGSSYNHIDTSGNAPERGRRYVRTNGGGWTGLGSA